MSKVSMNYEYTLVAGKGNSSARSMADEAKRKAEEFYGDVPHEVQVVVSGKPTQYYVQCVARANVEVEVV